MTQEVMAEYVYVPLERRFSDIGAEDPEDDPTADLMLKMRGEKSGKSWDDLLEHDIAVILGSAGSGKTTEIRQQAKRLREAGTSAFSLRLEALCREPLKKSFFPDDEDSPRSYSQWKRDGGRAVVFLDALDEARLPAARNGSVLADAFANLSEGLGRSGNDLKIVLTTRGSEWRGSPDLDLVLARIAALREQEKAGGGDGKQEISSGVYRLRTLDIEDIQAIAASRGIEPEKFVAVVNRSLSANLIRQPLEVHFLIDIWLEELARGNNPESAFSSRVRVLDRIVSSRVRAEQGGERRSDVDPIQARRACEKLAAAVIIANLRDISPTGAVDGTLSALDVLANDEERWNERDVRQVLSCALFHPSVAGRIRFAHREIQDYLAARFFNQAIDGNAGSLDALLPLVAKGLGPLQVPQSTEHVAGWLATLNPIARPYFIRLKPALLIETGDPLSLSSEERIAALEAQVALYQERRYRGEWFYRDDIRRFASPELAPAVERLLGEATSPEVREFLVEVVRYGQIHALSPLLAEIAQSQNEPLRTRTEACFALTEFADYRYAQVVFEAFLSESPPACEDVDAAPPWNGFVAAVLEYVCPSVVPTAEARQILERLRREANNHSSMTSRHFEKFVVNAGIDECAELLPVLLELAAGDRNPKNYQLPDVVLRYRTIARAIGRMVVRLLSEGRAQENVDVVLDALEYLFSANKIHIPNRGDLPFKEISAALLPSVFVKSQLIDRRLFAVSRDDKIERRVADDVVEPLRFDQGQDIETIFSLSDIDAACERILSAGSSRERRIAYEVAREINWTFSEVEEQERGWRKIVETLRRTRDRELISETSRSLWKRLNGLYYRFRHMHIYQWSRKLRRYRDDAVSRYWRARNLCQFVLRASRIKNADERGILHWAAERAWGRSGKEAIDLLKREYGASVASWFESGFRAYWRRYANEHSDGRTLVTIAGLTGLELEAEGGPILVNADEARNAFEYAFCDLNHLPEWAPALVEEHRDAFLDVFGLILEEELRAESGEREFPSSGISHVAYAGRNIRDIVAPLLIVGVQSHLPCNRADLELIVQMVARSKAVPVDDFRDFFRTQFMRSVTEFDFASAWIWLDGLFIADATAAWDVLLQAFPNGWQGASGSLFVNFLAYERRHISRAEEWSFERDDLPRNAVVLGNLIKVAFLVWPPDRDPRHEDVYTPGVADRASRRRRHYLDWLVELNSPAALECSPSAPMAQI